MTQCHKNFLVLLFGRASAVQKIFSHYVCYTSVETQLRARSLKILSRSDHICRSKEVKVPKIDRNLLKLAILKLFQPGITQGILKSTVKKANYQVSVC